MNKTKEYAVYRGDSFMFIGTAKECSERLGCSVKSFLYYLTPSYKRKVAKRKNAVNYIIVVKFDDCDNEIETGVD
jgi:hypothetical protein